MSNSPSNGLEVVIAIPVFNDMDSLNRLLEHLDRALAGQPLRTRVLVIDDGSTESTPLSTAAMGVQNIWRIDRLRLRRNLGHQRAIAVGLGHFQELAPAHNWLYSEFDKSVGHFRRYNKRTLAAVGPEALTLNRLIYLDCVGLLESISNRFILRQAIPTKRELLVWDRLAVPCSRILDPLLAHRLGKTLLAIWE